MSLNWKQFEFGVLRPTLAEVASIMPAPEVAVRLVGETIWHESDRLQALGQYPRGGVTLAEPFGPGLGIASIEEPTWDWMKERAEGWGWPLSIVEGSDYSELGYDLRLNVVACRLRYFLDKRALPRLEDGMDARATYWLMVYNGSKVLQRREKYITDAKAIPWEAA